MNVPSARIPPFDLHQMPLALVGFDQRQGNPTGLVMLMREPEMETMHFKTIIVQLEVDAPSAQLVEFACEVASRFEAGLIGFAAAEPRLTVPSEVGGSLSVDAIRIQVEEIEALLEDREKEFRTVTANTRRASWRSQIGHPTRSLARHARAADLVITGAGPCDLFSNGYRTINHGDLVLAAGRPVLLPSGSLHAVRAERILIAWKDTREARRAVSDALPFLTRASHVMVTTIEEMETLDANESVNDVARYLVRHGVRAHSQTLGAGRSDPAIALKEVAREMGADMIVAGGYGHSRIRELVFGGVTRSLLCELSLNRLISN